MGEGTRRLAGLAAGMVFCLLSGAALAQCPGPDDLKRGLLIDRQGAGTARAVALADSAVQIDYDHARRGYTDRRDMALGLFETRILSISDPPDVIGVWSERNEMRDHVGRFPRPTHGTTWQTTINLRWTLSDFSGMPQGGRARMAATYAFLAPVEVTLSGCAQSVMPVELRLRGDGRDMTTRYAYFPALGLAVETQVTNHLTGTVRTTGITALRPAP